MNDTVVLSYSDWPDLIEKLHNRELTISNMKGNLAALPTWYRTIKNLDLGKIVFDEG